MSGRAFFDTSVLVYSLGAMDPRGRRAEQLLSEGGVVSVQVLNEFADVARRKIRMSWEDVREALRVIQVFCPDPAPITREHALIIAEMQDLRIYDADSRLCLADQMHHALFGRSPGWPSYRQAIDR